VKSRRGHKTERKRTWTAPYNRNKRRAEGPTEVLEGQEKQSKIELAVRRNKGASGNLRRDVRQEDRKGQSNTHHLPDPSGTGRAKDVQDRGAGGGKERGPDVVGRQ